MNIFFSTEWAGSEPGGGVRIIFFLKQAKSGDFIFPPYGRRFFYHAGSAAFNPPINWTYLRFLNFLIFPSSPLSFFFLYSPIWRDLFLTKPTPDLYSPFLFSPNPPRFRGTAHTYIYIHTHSAPRTPLFWGPEGGEGVTRFLFRPVTGSLFSRFWFFKVLENWVMNG